MGIELYKLTTRKVATISEKGYYSDGGGLYLQVTETGAKSWLLRYRFGAKRPEMGLGPTHTVYHWPRPRSWQSRRAGRSWRASIRSP